MEDEWNFKTQLLLAVHKAEEWDEVVYDRFRRIFWTDQIKPCSTNRVDLELGQQALVRWYEPAIRSGNSFLRVRQSSVYQLSCSGVTTLMVV